MYLWQVEIERQTQLSVITVQMSDQRWKTSARGAVIAYIFSLPLMYVNEC